jgi:TfoX/Sxy family transcriptional regulator of competence genes
VKIPRADNELELFFRSILPDNPSVTVRPMFGNLAGFVNGNLFAGLYGKSVFVRLAEKDRGELLTEKGAKLFEPMKGRPMKEYVCFPPSWVDNSLKIAPWISKSLEHANKLPPKEKRKKIR